MRIRVSLKKLGKRKPEVEPFFYEISGTPHTVRELILAVTEAEVEAYNRRREEGYHAGPGAGGSGNRSEGESQAQGVTLLPYLTKEAIQEKAQAGKVAFGLNYGEKEADVEAAKENALQSFEDGIYRIFQDEKELASLEEPIDVTEDSVFTFVRLVMLAGRMW